VIAWLVIYESPRRNRWLSEKEAAEFRETPVVAEMAVPKASWWSVVLSRPGLMVILPRFLTDPVIYFVIFWLPNYLEKERGFDLSMIADHAWMPFVYGGVPGYLIGGLLSGWLMRSGRDVGRSRKIAMTIGAAFLPAAILAPFVPSSGLAIAAMCLVVFGHAVWISNLMALPVDLFSPGAVATAAGVSGMGGAIGGALANLFTGLIVTHFSYMPIFVCAGLLHPFAVLLVWRLLPERYFRSNV
jgi:ACS family hexuronate transporter-like MFS transporter